MTWILLIIGILSLLLREHCISVSKGGKGGSIVWRYGSYIEAGCNTALVIVVIWMIGIYM